MDSDYSLFKAFYMLIQYVENVATVSTMHFMSYFFIVRVIVNHANCE